VNSLFKDLVHIRLGVPNVDTPNKLTSDC